MTEKKMVLSDKDYRLSMKTSSRGKLDGQLSRSLIVHRLRDGVKAVLRRPGASSLRSLRYGIYCEPCDWWMNVTGAPEKVRCSECGRVYVLEYAVFTVMPGTEPASGTQGFTEGENS